MSAQFDLVEVVAIPLTPVHVGGGEEAVLRPESYRIVEDRLEVFAVARALEALPENERRQLADAIVRDPLGGLDRVRRKIGPDQVLETIGLGDASRDELRRVLDPRGGRQRSGDVQLFQRSGGRPVLPGSTLKGALRTAWLARCARGIDHLPGHASGQRHTELEKRAFRLAEGKAKTDTDPMRDVTVADALLPPGATRIDRVLAWKKLPRRGGGEDVYGASDTGQMHWERLRSVADGAEPPVLRLSIGLRSAVVRHDRSGLRADAVPPRAPGAVAELLAALNAHHVPLWRREAEEKFFAGEAGERLRATRGPLAALKLEGPDPDAALVRVGRGGHAESKSVEAFREVHRPQARDPREKRAPEGSTRHVVEVGGAHLPFGWMLLVRADRYHPPARWLDPPGPVARPREERGGGVQPAPAVPLLFRRGEVAFVDGERVTIQEDVPPGAGEVNVAFPGGDIETVSIDEIEKP